MGETIQFPAPAQSEDLQGLTAEQQAENEKLMANYKTRVDQHEYVTEYMSHAGHFDKQGPQSATTNITGAIEKAVKGYRAGKAEGKATEHFQKNEVAYHEQALIEDTQRSEQKVA